MRGGNLFVDHRVEQAARVLRGDQQIVETHRAVRVFDEVKHPTHFVGDARVGGQQRVVRIKSRGFLVKVTGPDVGVAHHVVTFFTGNQEQFGVNFQARRGEDDVYTGFRQTTSPVDVRFFVETGLQLNHYRHFFTVVGSVNHRIYDARVFRHAVNVDLNSQHVRVERRLTQQFQHVLKGVVRIVEQHVALTDGVESVTEFIEPNMAQTRQRLVNQVSFTDVREANKVFKVVVTPARHDGVVAGNGQLVAQHFHHRVWHISLINKAHRFGGQTLFQAGGHQFHQTGFHLVHKIVFGVAGHFHGVGVQRIVIEEAFENVVQAVAQNVVQ
ncbi:hypothetical protein D3C71_995280 [compost metagenome]